ncbi:hypothetical protein [Mesorhizobium sp.]|uniref:hypothetical protein n=1 Tax=Mesorhizobium sp. TaxID=1871066 RepID=UPI00257AB817|nr:hypothetical protein [Mesorhizobium sp.]
MRQLLHGQFAVGNVAQKNQPVCMPEGTGEVGYLVNDRMMDICVFHIAWYDQSNDQSIH